MRGALVGMLVAAAACGSFEDPDIVIDFRVLALHADRPEQVIDVDIREPRADDVLQQLVPAEVCVLLSDRNFTRRLRWEMTLCDLNNDDRCHGSSPRSRLGEGLWDDPDLAQPPPRLCATIPADGNLIGVALHFYERDQLFGLGGIYYGISLRVGGEDADPALDLFAAKRLRLMPRIPAEVRANNNPTLDALEIRLAEDGAFAPLPLGRCLDQAAPIEMAAGQRIRVRPAETAGAREEYVVPTTDGMSRMFTESLTYQWLATAGNFSSGATGGPRDPFGNPAPLFTDWTAPAAKDLTGPTDIELWVIQRDERLGLTWYESCLRVIP